MKKLLSHDTARIMRSALAPEFSLSIPIIQSAQKEPNFCTIHLGEMTNQL